MSYKEDERLKVIKMRDSLFEDPGNGCYKGIRRDFVLYPNCGYERQPKDEGMVPATECPRCGILYGKIKDENEGAGYTAKQQRIKRGEFQKNVGTTGKTKKSGHLVVFIFIVVVCIAIGYYFHMNKGDDLVSIDQMNVRIFTTST